MKTKAKIIASFKIWVVIYPSITAFLYILAEPLSRLPLYQSTLILTISLVPWIVFVGLPIVNTVADFLFPKPENINKSQTPQ